MGTFASEIELPWRCSRGPLSWVALAGILASIWCGPRLQQASGAGKRDSSPPTHLRLLNLAGQEVDPFKVSDAKWFLFVFISVDCPISNRYAPEIRRLHARFAPRGVQFWLVHPNADESVEAIRKHTEEYQYPFGVLRDSSHLLVKHAKIRVTPEVALFSREGPLVYRGRIDNRFVEFGKERSAPTEHDLEQALDAVIDGKPVSHPSTKAVGCYIPALP